MSYFDNIPDGTFPNPTINTRFNWEQKGMYANFGIHLIHGIIGDTSELVLGVFLGLSGNALNVFMYVFVDGLWHACPYGSKY